jgi:hypothetical protein
MARPRSRKAEQAATEDLTGTEFDSDVSKAAKAVDSPREAKPKKEPHARLDSKMIERAKELRTKEHLGIVALTRRLTEEGFPNTKGSDLVPQSVRQVLIREGAWDPRPNPAEPKRESRKPPGVDITGTLKAGVEQAKPSRSRKKVEA